MDGFLNFDLNVHGWDLARAVGADDRIDPAEVPWLRREAEAFGEAARGGPGAPFGPVLQPPAGADEQAELLAYLGRNPAW